MKKYRVFLKTSSEPIEIQALGYSITEGELLTFHKEDEDIFATFAGGTWEYVREVQE